MPFHSINNIVTDTADTVYQQKTIELIVEKPCKETDKYEKSKMNIICDITFHEVET